MSEELDVKKIYENLKDYYYTEMQKIAFKIAKEIKETKESISGYEVLLTILNEVENHKVFGDKDLRMLFSTFTSEEIDMIAKNNIERENSNDKNEVVFGSAMSLMGDINKLVAGFMGVETKRKENAKTFAEKYL
jgi:hypothetical protein